MTKKKVPTQAKAERKRHSPEFEQQALLRAQSQGHAVCSLRVRVRVRVRVRSCAVSGSVQSQGQQSQGQVLFYHIAGRNLPPCPARFVLNLPVRFIT